MTVAVLLAEATHEAAGGLCPVLAFAAAHVSVPPAELRHALFPFVVVMFLSWCGLMAAADDITASSRFFSSLALLLGPVGWVAVFVWMRLLAADDTRLTPALLLPLVGIGLVASVPGVIGTHLYLRWKSGPDPRQHDAVPVRVVRAEWTPDTGDGALLVLHRHPNERAWVPAPTAAPQGPGTVSLSVDGASAHQDVRYRAQDTREGVPEARVGGRRHPHPSRERAPRPR